ncbi:MAG: MarR family transcriptional regulator [bacterium]|nr:MarR family transcriptional regulator [bacterium]
MKNKNKQADIGIIDDLTFYSMLSVLQGGMWLLNDIENFLKDYGISHGRFSILLSIMETPDKSTLPIEIARKLGKSKPTITNMMKKLEDDGLVSTIEDSDDGRAKRLVLTKKAKNLLDEIIPLYNKRISTMSEHLSEDDKYTLMRIISKINFLDPSKNITVTK